jgi:hypothetical protein
MHIYIHSHTKRRDLRTLSHFKATLQLPHNYCLLVSIQLPPVSCVRFTNKPQVLA